MKNVLTILFIAVLVGGCNTITHMDQLLTLKAVGDEQGAIDKEVASANKKFENLFLAAQKENFAKEYPTKKKVLNTFGEPIMAREEAKDGEQQEFLLYRRAKEFFDSDKVYLFFNTSGDLVSFQVVKKPTAATK